MDTEVYKMEKITENQMIEIQIILQKLEAREELRKTLKRRKEIVIK